MAFIRAQQSQISNAALPTTVRLLLTRLGVGGDEIFIELLARALPEPLDTNLPTMEEIEAVLSRDLKG